MTLLYFVLGPVPILAHFISAMIGTIVVRNIYRTTALFGGPSAANLCAGIWAILPSFVFVTSLAVRDHLIHLLISSIIYYMVRIEIRNEIHGNLHAAACLGLAYFGCYLRPHQVLFIMGAFVISGFTTFFWGQRKSPSTRLYLRILGAGAIILILFGNTQCFYVVNNTFKAGPHFINMMNNTRFAFIHGHTFNRWRNLKVALEKRENVKEELARVLQRRKDNQQSVDSETIEELHGRLEESEAVAKKAKEGFDKVKKEVYGSISRQATSIMFAHKNDLSWDVFLIRLPLRVVVYLLSPFPWQTQTGFLKVAVLENLVFYFFLLAGLLSVPALFRSRSGWSHFVLAYIFLSLIAYGLAQGNLGTGYRHRMQFVWLFFIPGAIYLSEKFGQWKGGLQEEPQDVMKMERIR